MDNLIEVIGLIAIVSIFYYAFYGLIFRKILMRNFSKKFNLNFKYYPEDNKKSFISGEYNGHSILIYDFVHSNLMGRSPYMETVITVDGQKRNIPKNWQGYNSIGQLKKLLSELE